MKLFLLAFLLLNCSQLSAQTQTETLKYINEHINIDADALTRKQGLKYTWTVSSDGKLLTKVYHRDGHILESKSFYLKAMCIEPECITIDVFDNTGLGSGVYLVFGPDSNKPLIITVSDVDAAKRIKNAVIRLIKLAKANNNYKNKDPFDY